MDRRCDKCIHHNVCEVYDIVHDPSEASGCRNFLDTNDVAPKSEVEALEKEIERLTGILNAYALQYGTATDKEVFLRDAKTEVAREIFEELDGITDLFAKGLVEELAMYDMIAALKKKYTEEKE